MFLYGGAVVPSCREGPVCPVLPAPPRGRAATRRPAAAPGSSPCPRPAGRWRRPSLFLLAFPLHLAGASAWLWGPLYALAYVDRRLGARAGRAAGAAREDASTSTC